MTHADFRDMSDDDLATFADRAGVPERYLPLLHHLRDADVPAEAAVKSALREHDKDYLRENDARESIRLWTGQAGLFGTQVEHAWARVAEAIADRAHSARPKPKSYEVHLEFEVSRDAFLVALHKSGDPAAAAEVSIARGLPLDFEPLAASPTP